MTIQEKIRQAYRDEDYATLSHLVDVSKVSAAVTDAEQDEFVDLYLDLTSKLTEKGDRKVKKYSRTQNVVTVTYNGQLIASFLENR